MASLVSADKTPAGESKQDNSGHVEELFREFDADGSGSIDKEEFQDLAFACGETLTDEQVGQIVSDLDTDNNGTISLDEFKAWLEGSDKSAKGKDSVSRAKRMVLKSKLRTRYAARKLKQVSEGFQGDSVGSAADDYNQVSLSAAVGREEDIKMRVSLAVENPPAMVLDNMEGNSCVTLTLVAEEGTSDLQLGTLVGTLRTVYAAVAPLIGLEAMGLEVKFTPRDISGGRKGISVSVTSPKNAVMQDLPVPEQFLQILQAFTVSAGVGFDFDDVRAADEDTKWSDFMNAFSINYNVKGSREGLEGLATMLTAAGMVPPPAVPAMRTIPHLAEASIHVRLRSSLKSIFGIDDDMPKSVADHRNKLKSLLASAAGREGMVAALPAFGISEDDAQNLYNSVRFITGVKEISAVSRLGKMVVVSFENVEPFKDMLPEL